VKQASWQSTGAPEETIEDNWLFRLVRARFRSRATGREHDYYVMRLADAVNVIALTPAMKVILVRQFRAGSGDDSLETPGGLLDPGEDPFEAGARELAEETGYEGDPPEVVSTCWANPSILSSRLVTILIRNARFTRPPSPDTHEELKVELVAAKHIPRMIRSGEISHALAIQGLQTWLISDLSGSDAARAARRRARQTSIAWIMALIAVAALVMWIVRTLGIQGAMSLAIMFAFPLGLASSLWLLDDLTRPILVRDLRLTLRYRLARLLVALATGVVILFVLVLFYRLRII
jgi:8-oxo-dGTP pyrophosphatase MutT (NUDIX family)